MRSYGAEAVDSLTRPIDDSELDKVVSIVRNSFRVHENQDPIYVDVAGNLERVAAWPS
jgi:hypothetical protein